MSVSTALHTAVFSTLTTALAGHAAVIAGRLDPNQSWPAVHVGDVTVSSSDGIGSERSLRTVQITAFSEAAGPAEVMDLIGYIKAALHRQRITLSEGHAVDTRIAREATQLDGDGMTYTGSCWFEVRTSP